MRGQPGEEEELGLTHLGRLLTEQTYLTGEATGDRSGIWAVTACLGCLFQNGIKAPYGLVINVGERVPGGGHSFAQRSGSG